MNLKIDHHLSLGYFLPKDVIPLAEYLNDLDIYNSTLRIPHPYTLKDAEEHVALNLEKQLHDSIIENYTIRLDDEIVGGIGFMPGSGFQSHIAEIGYWLAKPFRNKGIMTKTIGFFCNMIFENHSFAKLTAGIFPENIASKHVLEKNGFIEEGFLKKYYKKGDKYIDCRVYALMKD